MSLIVIRGSAEVVRGLADIEGLKLDDESATRDGENWQLTAEATDAAIAEVQGRGATVEVLMTTAQYEEHMAQVMAQIQGDPDEPSGGG